MRSVKFILLFFVLALILDIASAQVISPNPIGEPGFETVSGWTTSTSCYSTCQFEMQQYTPWHPEGTYSYQFWVHGVVGIHFQIGDYIQVSRTVNMDNIERINIASNTESWAGFFTLKLFVDSTEIPINGYIGSYGFSGSHTLRVRFVAISNLDAPGTDNLVWDVDNLVAYNNTAPTIPSVTAPTNNSEYHPRSFSWSTSTDVDSDAISYNWQRAEDSGFSVNMTQGNTSSTSYSFTTPWIKNKIYYIKVRATDGYEWSSFSPTIQYTAVNNLSASIISSPTNNSRQYNNTVTNYWNTSYNPEGDTITYNWQRAEDSGFSVNVTQGNTTSTNSGAISTVDGKIYYVRVLTGDGYENSSFSPTVQYTENSLPSIPVTNQHSDYHTLNSTNITWNICSDSEGDTCSYDYKIWNITTNTIVLQGNTGNLYSPNFAILNFTNYSYSVNSYDGYESSGWSANKTFGFVNNVPTIINVTLSPSAPSITDNLSVNFNVTDLNGDTLTNYTLWYKNGILQQSLNDSLIVLASGNTSAGELWRVDVFSNDGYNNSTSLSSNEVIIGSTNIAPTYTSITITPTTGQIGTVITINATGIVDDSTSWRLQTYYLAEDSSKVYMGNSSWSNNTTILYTVISPWSDSGTYTIYTNVYDSGNSSGVQNLTSSTASNFFVSQITTTVITQPGSGGGGAPPTPTPIVTSTPMVSTINLPSLLQESTGQMILYILFIIGLVIIYVGTTNKRSTLGTIVTGFIFIGFSIYGLYGIGV